MRTSGRGASEKAMVLIPAGVLLVSMMLFAGGPGRFLQTLNQELGHLYVVIMSWIETWVV